MNDLPAPQHASTLLQQIERLVRSDIDPARIQQVLDLYNEERNRAQLEEFHRDLGDLQGEIAVVKARGLNPNFKNAYPKLDDLVISSREYLDKYGFGIRFGTVLQKKYETPIPPPAPGMVRVVLVLFHKSGHWEESYFDSPPDIQPGSRARTPVQGIGSTSTYLRRYLLQMALNLVAGVDDDGRGGVDEPVTPEQIEEIKRHIQTLGYGEERVSDMFRELRVSTYGQIRASQYIPLINTLTDRIGRMPKREPGEDE